MENLDSLRLHKKEDALMKLVPRFRHGPRAVYWFKKVDSTMDTAFGLPDREISDRAVVIADEQTLGRGRFSRRWVSTGEDITFSVILPSYDFRAPYSMIASLAVYRALRRNGGCVRLKWINDVLWENGKKISGAITEEKSNRTVIGIGLNLNSAALPPDISETATSYYIETGRRLIKEEFLSILIEELFGQLDRVDKGGLRDVLAEWEADARLEGRRVTVVSDRGMIRGTVCGINKNSGALILKTGQGPVEVYEGKVVQDKVC
jgi:BirA family biotin operon repressor/biotin-[acetyl-CoA-carboxylase] ligase